MDGITVDLWILDHKGTTAIMGSRKTNIAVHFELKTVDEEIERRRQRKKLLVPKEMKTIGNPLAWGQRGVQLQRGAGWQMLRDLQSGPRWRVA